MRKLKDKFLRFMYGRNGIDELNKFIFSLYLILLILYFFINHISIIIIISVFLFIYIYRFLSKKLYTRQRENTIYLNITRKITRPFKRLFNQIKDRKTHVYRKCHNCKQVLRLRRVKGKHMVKCPICANRFEVTI